MSVSPNLSGFLIYANLHLLDNVSLFYTGKTYNRDFSLVSTRNIFFFHRLAVISTKYTALLGEREDVSA